MNNTQILFCIAQLRGYGPAALRKLLGETLPDEAADIPDFLKIKNTEDIKSSIDSGLDLWDRSISLDIGILSPLDTHYPEKLRTLPDLPALISYKGDLSCLEGPAVAVIGSRDASAYALKAGPRLTQYFIEAGFTIVSGLAKGCDTIAHRAAVESGSPTAAVLPCGLPSIYPAENVLLAAKILDTGGVLLSEQPFSKSPRAGDFVQRDRLQSGLSLGVAVIETTASGGTMHTVRFASKQQRPVACLFAAGQVPEGNQLIIDQFKGVKLKDRDDINAYIRLLLDTDGRLG